MKNRNILSLVLVLLMLLGALTGCGASSSPNTYRAQGAKAEMSADEMPAEAPMAMDAGALAERNGGSDTALPEARKWIVTMNISAETEDLDAMTDALTEKITAMEGYVEDQRVYNGSTRTDRRYRNATLTIRIPAGTVDSFTQEVSGISNVVSREKNLEDITLRYVATESRLTALQTEEARLLELLAQAETMADLLEIEARLTDVRYELESVASQKRLYDNQIDYATVYLYIEEVQEYTPVEDPTVWQRISDGFTGSIKGLGRGCVTLFVWLIAYSPYLLALALVITVIVVLVKRKRKNRKAKDQPQT